MPNLTNTIEKVRSFLELPIGWHFGEGVPARSSLATKSIYALELASEAGISRMNAFPGVEGQVQITFYHRSSVLELNLEIDGTVTVAMDEGDEQVEHRENVDWFDSLNEIKEFSERIWSSSESSIQGITIPKKEGFQARPSSLPVTAKFPLSTTRVPSRPAVRFASMSLRSTVPSRETRSSTGKCLIYSYRSNVKSNKGPAIAGMIATTTSTAGQKTDRLKRLRK